MWLEESPSPFFKYSPPQGGPGSGEDKEAKLPLLDFYLEAPLELGPEVNHSFQELAGSSEEEDRNRSSPKPLVEEYERWVNWRAQAHDMPGWWQELAEVPEIDNHQELAWEVQASFKLPWQITEQHGVENYYQAPPALLCICQKSFLPQPDPKFACWDIRELQLEKMVAYAQALQFGVEKANLPTQGQPCLLAGSVVELREEMKCYVSFPDKAIFSGMALQEGSLTMQSKETTPKNAQPVYFHSPAEEVAMKATEKEPTRREQPPNQFPGWREVLHPSRLVITAGQIPPISRGSKQRPHSRSSGESIVRSQWADEELKAQNIKSEPMSPTNVLDIAQQVTPPSGFLQVKACLWRSPSLGKAHDVPPEPLQIAAVMEPTVVTMSASCIIKDKAMGVTYMDTMTTSVGQVALSGPKQGAPTKGPIIEDITDLS